ncbi:MAG: DNA-processing protein DprA [Bacteroidales bacterium]
MASIYDIAFANIHGIGPSTAKEIMKIYSSTEDFFNESRSNLESIFKTKTRTINEILNKTMFPKVEKEMEFMEKYNIKCLFFTAEDYPRRLLQLPDNPICFYFQGNRDLNMDRMVGVVGTRNATEYGREQTENIISELKAYNVGIVSGLAYGIDAISHRQSIKQEIPTFAVLGHGLDMIYPKENHDLALEMINNGGLVTEFMTSTRPERYNFPRRNRIIAGLCDCIIVIEAAKKSGSLVTADLANQYDREVFALPGRVGDMYSEGCNYLISSQRASIIHDPQDIIEIMNWEFKTPTLFKKEIKKPSNLSKDESIIYDIIMGKEEIHIDDISIECTLNPSVLASCLLNLELEGIIRCMPKKTYKICS